MVVTNELIDNMISKLGKEQHMFNAELRSIEDCIQTLFTIKMRDDKEMPLDRSTGEPMNEERREVVFNSVVKRAGKYLGENK